MPYKKPLCEKGVRERPYAHFIKLCWFEVHFRDIKNEISFRKFCKNFKKIMEDTTIIEDIESDYGLEWEYYNEDGSLKEPNYEDIKSNQWRKKYKYKELYGVFKSDKLMSTEVTEREKYIRHMAKLNSHDYDLLDRCYEKEDEYTAIEESNGKDMTYYRNKNNETISNTDERLRKRNGFDKTKLEVEGNVKADVKQTITSSEIKAKQLKELRERMDEMTYD